MPGCDKQPGIAVFERSFMILSDMEGGMREITKRGGMTLINLPACMLREKVAIDTLKDYEKQKKEGKNPVFLGKNIGINTDEPDYWK